MLKLAGFCDNDTAVALSLAGIKELYISDDDEVQIWGRLIEREDLGVIFITESVAEKLGQRLKNYRLRNALPVFLEIPDKKGKLKDHDDFISHLIKKAVGIDVSKEKKTDLTQ